MIDDSEFHQTLQLLLDIPPMCKFEEIILMHSSLIKSAQLFFSTVDDDKDRDSISSNGEENAAAKKRFVPYPFFNVNLLIKAVFH